MQVEAFLLVLFCIFGFTNFKSFSSYIILTKGENQMIPDLLDESKCALLLCFVRSASQRHSLKVSREVPTQSEIMSFHQSQSFLDSSLSSTPSDPQSDPQDAHSRMLPQEIHYQSEGFSPAC